MKDWEFWGSLRQIVRRDESREVPAASVRRGLALFRPRPRGDRVLRLRPALAEMVRGQGSQARLVYESETSGQFVELCPSAGDNGFDLAGFSSDGDMSQAMLFGSERVYEAAICDGEFTFKSLPPGCYTMSLGHEGEDLWIPRIELGQAETEEV